MSSSERGGETGQGRQEPFDGPFSRTGVDLCSSCEFTGLSEDRTQFQVDRAGEGEQRDADQEGRGWGLQVLQEGAMVQVETGERWDQDCGREMEGDGEADR